MTSDGGLDPRSQTEPRPFPGPDPNALTGAAHAALIVGLGVAVLSILLIPAGWWSAASPALREVLEALPLGGAVATSPDEHGKPLLISFLALLLVGLAIWATTQWRTASMRNYVHGGNTFVGVFTVGMIRTATIFGGLTLVPILGYVAAGTDLREEPGYTFTGPVWPFLVIGCWTAFTFFDLRRAHARETGAWPL